MKKRIILGAIAAVAGLIVVGQTVYTVDETEQVVITEFGKPVGDPISDAGIHFRKPFVQEVNRFPKQILEWDGERTEIPTADKRYLWVDTTARWRIVDPLLFLKSVRSESAAQGRLDDIVDAATRDQISAEPLVEMIRVSNRIIEEPEEDAYDAATSSEYMNPIQVGRETIATRILQSAKPQVLEKFGIELVDVRIKRINYTPSVRDKVYERMVSERQKIAEKFRSEGEGLRAEITGKMEREEKEVLSAAFRDAQQIIAKADADAARIFADAYGRDPEFYSFWRSLEAYENVIGDNHTLVIDPESDLYRYLFSAKGK